MQQDITRIEAENAASQAMSGAPAPKIISRSSVAGLSLIETLYPASLAMPRHAHENAYFSFVLKGAYTECVGQSTQVCNASNLVFHPPDEAHSVQFHSANVRIFRVELDSAWLERIRQHSAVMDRPLAVQGGLPACLAIRLHREFQHKDSAAMLAVEGLTLEIVASASRWNEAESARKPPRWLLQVRDLLQARFMDNLSLEEIAGAVGVHPVHLSRTFHAHYHCTLGDWVRRLRVEFACRQIALSDASLSEIALTAGFADQSHFTRAFRQQMGLSPGEYRKAFR